MQKINNILGKGFRNCHRSKSKYDSAGSDGYETRLWGGTCTECVNGWVPPSPIIQMFVSYFVFVFALSSYFVSILFCSVFFIFRFLISCVFVVFLPRMTQVFCSLGMKDMMFQHRQKSNPMLWRVRNAEFVERRFGRDGLGVIEKIVIKSYYPKCSLLNNFFFIRTRA